MGDIFDTERPILNGGDREVLQKYESYEEPSEPSEFADYLRAFARLIPATSQPDTFHMGNIQRMVGVANEVERGERSVENAKEWVRELDVSKRPNDA